MSEKEKKILELFAKLVPRLPEEKQERLLLLGEGMVLMTDYYEEKEKSLHPA